MSVRRLGTCIDVLQIQRMDPDVPCEEIMRALNDVIEKGWVRYIGASSMPAWEFQMLEEEREMIPYCKATGVGPIPWSPNPRGVLSRPWGSETESIRASSDLTLLRLLLKDDPANEAVVRIVQDIARERGLSMATVSIAWCLSKGVNPIVGLNSKERINEAVRAVKVLLSSDEIGRLEAAYVPRNVIGY